MTMRGNTTQRGDVAEFLFIAEAARRGHIASRPCTVDSPYDVVIGGASRRLLRVQVRSAWVTNRRGAYGINCDSHSTGLFTRDHIDLLAAYVAPEDVWYIIPVAALPQGKWHVHLFPHDPARDARWQPYRDAWRLLGRPHAPPLPRPRSTLRRKFLPLRLARRAY